jgi:hypothetical protein
MLALKFEARKSINETNLLHYRFTPFEVNYFHVNIIYIYTSFDTRAMPRVIFFCIKNIKKNKKIKILGFSAKLYPIILGLAATPDLRVIFIILIVKLNLHDPSLSESGCNTGPTNIGCGSGYKVVS